MIPSPKRDPVMLPIIVAGSRPAAAVLAQKRPFNCDTSVDLYRLRHVHVNITETGRSHLPFPSTVLLNPIGSLPLPHAQQPNRHRARGTASRIHSRDFLPWRFSNAGPQPRSSRRRPSSAGIRKPSQNRKLGAILLRFDICRLDDWPPLLDLGLVAGTECIRCLLLARENLLSEICETLDGSKTSISKAASKPYLRMKLQSCRESADPENGYWSLVALRGAEMPFRMPQIPRVLSR